MTPIKTTGRLHFDDLSHERFEDMCVQIFYNLKTWTNIQHFGRKGQDGGVDIFGETIEDEGQKETWVIQCKRYRTISPSQLEAILDDFLAQNKNIPDHYLLLLACDLSRNVYERFKKYGEDKGFHRIEVMTASVLEAELYARHPDILYTFFGIQSTGRRVAGVAKIRRRISMKKKFEREFSGTVRGRSDVIIHDVHRDVYPDQDLHSPGISPWFKLEYFRPYYRGVSFYTRVVNVLVDQETGNWKLTDHDSKVPKDWIRTNAFQIGNIPYDNIVDIDVNGDEFYPFPHFYCEFSNLGEPYEEIWYMPTDEFKSQVFELPKDRQSE